MVLKKKPPAKTTQKKKIAKIRLDVEKILNYGRLTI